MKRRKYWTPAEEARLRALYPDMPTAAVARTLRRDVGRVYAKASAMGFKKSAEYLASPHACRLRRGDNVGAAHRFKKGLTPWNKGKHFTAGGRSAQTRFKKGQKPATWMPILSERVADGYLQVKLTDTGYPPHDWRPVHVVLWEYERGPVPPGHAVVFKDGNRSNIVIENLECISRAELIRRNTIHNYPPELASVIRLTAKLRRTIEKASEKQDQRPA